MQTNRERPHRSARSGRGDRLGIHAFAYTALNEVPREKMMTEHNARRLAFTGASLIASLILLCVMLNFTFPQESLYRNGFWVCLGLLFLYVRAMPKKFGFPIDWFDSTALALPATTAYGPEAAVQKSEGMSSALSSPMATTTNNASTGRS